MYRVCYQECGGESCFVEFVGLLDAPSSGTLSARGLHWGTGSKDAGILKRASVKLIPVPLPAALRQLLQRSVRATVLAVSGTSGWQAYQQQL